MVLIKDFVEVLGTGRRLFGSLHCNFLNSIGVLGAEMHAKAAFRNAFLIVAGGLRAFFAVTLL
jgi:hypothetical protein